MNTTKILQAVSTLRSPLLCTKRIPTRPFRTAGLYRLNQSRFASTDSQLSRDERRGLSNLRGILTIAIPSIFLTWALLEYYDPHQRGQHSHMMKEKLLGTYLLAHFQLSHPLTEIFMQMRTKQLAVPTTVQKCMSRTSRNGSSNIRNTLSIGKR